MMNNKYQKRTQFAIFGIGFGLLFPVIGTIIELIQRGLQFSIGNISFIHQTDPLILIIDTAPFVIGLASYLIGTREDNLIHTNALLKSSNLELQINREELEQRVMERTNEIDEKSKQTEKQTAKLEAVTQVSRLISSQDDLEILLPRLTNLISQNFGFYHTGIFLLDDEKKYAVLRAASSQGGARMLERGHLLEVGVSGIVGLVTSTGNARIALNTGADSVYFDNPDMPETLSEMALPLKAGNQIIGALDIQSKEPNAFTQDDIDVISAIADQVAIAIQNVNLHEDVRNALVQAERISNQLTAVAWSNIQNVTPVVGYHYDGNKPSPLTTSTNGKQASDQGDAFSVPVKLRGKSIGILRISPAIKGHQWTEDEISIIQATADRVALAAENARLVLESQKRASKEQVISEISTKIGAAVNVDNILQTTLIEMGRILPGAQINIQVENK